MKIEQVSAQKLKREYKVTVPANDFSTKMDQRLAEIAKKMKVPGFRPGKVPAKVVKQQHGQAVMGEVLQLVVEQSSREALKKENAKPALRPDIKIEKFEEGADLTFTMSFEVLPDVPEVKLEGITVTRPKVELEDEKVDEALKRMGEQMKHFHDKKDGAKAQKGDGVKIDFKGFIGDEAFEGGEAQGHTLELGSGQFIPGFEEQLIGSKAGDEVTVKVTFPKDYHSADLAGKEARFEVKVHKVLEAHGNTIDEAFAKELGFEDMKVLRDAVRQQLEGELAQACRARAKKQLFDVLNEKVNFDLPEKMLEMEFEAIWPQVERARKETPDAKEFKGKSDEALKEEYKKMAERRVRLGILLAEMGAKQNIKVSQDELRGAIIAEARQYPGQEQKVIEYYQQHPDQIESFRGPILEEKVVDFILEKVKVEEKKMTMKELNEMDI